MDKLNPRKISHITPNTEENLINKLRESVLDGREYSIPDILVNGCKVLYTPMQFAAKNGWVDLAKELLNAGIDPNFQSHDDDYSSKDKTKVKDRTKEQQVIDDVAYTKCTEYPVILAAEMGQEKLLHLFKYYNRDKEVRSSSSQVAIVKNDGEDIEMINATDKTKIVVNFNVTSSGKRKGTVLHTVLRQPLLEEKRIRSSMRIISQSPLSPQRLNISEHDLKNLELAFISERYRKCMKVLLDMDEFKPNQMQRCQYPRQMREIINHKDAKKNTALHYAVSNWSSEVVEKLLSLGANPSIENGHHEIPLSRISKSTFENF